MVASADTASARKWDERGVSQMVWRPCEVGRGRPDPGGMGCQPSMIRAQIMDQRTLAQLDIIREISNALTCARVDHWLFGGWAVDFAVGEMTRQHRDVDFVTWLAYILPEAEGVTHLARAAGASLQQH